MNEKISSLNVFFQHATDVPPFARSQDFADHLSALICLYDPERRIVEFANQKVKDFTGTYFENLTHEADALKSLVHEDDLVRFNNFLCLDGNQPRFCKLRLADTRGYYHAYFFEGKVIGWYEGGPAQRILLIGHDITDQVKSKEENETTRELLDETEELLQFGSWAWDIGTNTVTWTSGLYTLLEYNRHDVEGKTGLGFYLSHVLEEYSQPFQDTLQHALKEKTDFIFEYVVRTNSGSLKNISTRGKLVKDENGDVLKMLCINRDITALRSFEKEQERNIRELNRSNRDLEEFAYIASHDLQEPLRKISMFTERLKAKYEKTLDREGELFIDRILASSSNMRILIDNLLDFSRANRRSQPSDQVNIKSVLDGVISELELKIEETQTVISFSGVFPTIEAVPSEMTQLFSNILSNAIKFRKNPGVAEINVRGNKLSKAEKHSFGLPPGYTFYKIDVQDNGIGFESEYAEKIFQIFQRLNGKSEYPGSGIGLAICKKIVEKHNGLIFAKSEPDLGATFTIILPEKQF